MKKRCQAGIFCLVLLSVLFQAAPLIADDTPAGERDLSRVRKKVEALRAWQLTEELDLDEKTSSRLFPVIREADQERWRIEASNRDLVREMARSLKQADPDPEEINQILDKLQSNRRELVRAEERHLASVRQILSPEDTARYLMFQIRFQREIRQRAAQAYRDHGRTDDDMMPGGRDRMDDRDSDGGGFGGSGSGMSGGGNGGGSSGGGRR